MDRLISRPTWETTLPTAGPNPLATVAPTPWRSQMMWLRGNTLWPRFTAWYRQLQAWPRRLRRGLQRRLALPLTGVALLLALSQAPSLAATIVVDGTTCSLADAITAANTDTAQGGCPAGSEADILVLEPPGSTVTLTGVDNTTYGPTGLPVITSPITIAGQGGTIARSPSAPAFRLLAVNGSGTLTLQEITLTGGGSSKGGGIYNVNGTVEIVQSSITGNTASVRGGGVYNIDGTFMLTRSTISSNTAGSGGGVFNYAFWASATVTLTQSTISDNMASVGGAVFISSYDGFATVALTQTIITGNTASRGGGVFNDGCARYGVGRATLTLTQSTITGNTATRGEGGGVLNWGSTSLIQSTISGNTASHGGGVYNAAYFCSSGVTLTRSTISGNTAGIGGGVFNNSPGDGSIGSPATTTLTQSTITGNTASVRGGGVYNNSNPIDRATVTLAGSLVSGNLAPTAPEILDTDTGGTITADAFNLFGVHGEAGVTGFTPGPTDVVPSVPLSAILDPTLADHGGPTLTHALVPGSPALDAIPFGTQGCDTPVFGDQRGQARPQPAGGACDIGAYEVGVADQPLGAWVVGLAPETVVCTNLTTGQVVTLSEPASAWDCEAAGLGVRAGDQVAMGVRGTGEAGAPDVGGAVTGLQPRSARCTNLTTGQQVSFQKMRGATAGSCVAAGLAIHPGDRLQLRVQGEAE